MQKYYCCYVIHSSGLNTAKAAGVANSTDLGIISIDSGTKTLKNKRTNEFRRVLQKC